MMRPTAVTSTVATVYRGSQFRPPEGPPDPGDPSVGGFAYETAGEGAGAGAGAGASAAVGRLWRVATR